MSTEQTIYQKLKNTFSPHVLDVINESRMHGTAREDSHFKVVIVADAFESLKLIARHRAINNCLADELSGPVHALSINAYTADEWAKAEGVVPKSPACLGGSKNEQK
ncbi:BolA family protein [Gayadomonas joobiniege]|uniref:BolA family protein n=1 Tax=Gayadomonas joobiniege TaxID=1234606 RepID=UPI00036F0308|nr:BolA/IbaG family iron-sulfur metabolism protein [Gayadomonas joobiniege]